MTTTTVLDDDGDDRVWVSTREAADMLGLGIRQLYRLIDRGELPAYKFGRVIRLLCGEVAAFRDGDSGQSSPDG